jgi:hypothetical protein
VLLVLSELDLGVVVAVLLDLVLLVLLSVLEVVDLLDFGCLDWFELTEDLDLAIGELLVWKLCTITKTKPASTTAYTRYNRYLAGFFMFLARPSFRI